MKTRKILALALCAVMLVGASVLGTMAYMTDKTQEVKNTFTVGNVSFNEEMHGGLDEADVDENGELLYQDEEKTELNDRVIANAYKLVPNHTYVKDPTVHIAAGSEDCYVFVKVVNGLTEVKTIGEGNDAVTVNGIEAATERAAEEGQKVYKSIADQMAALGWVAVDGEDDIFYLDHVIEAVDADEDDEEVLATLNPVVFNEFKINGAVENNVLDLYKDAEITIMAYAVQADGFADAEAAWAAAPCAFGATTDNQ